MSSDDCGGVIRGNVRPLGDVYPLAAVEIRILGSFSLFAGKLAYGGAYTLPAAGIGTEDLS